MSEVFADTFFFLALLSERDEAHERAQIAASTLDGRLVTSHWVLTEVAAACAPPARRSRFLALMEFLRSSEGAAIVDLRGDLFDRGVDPYRQRPDKGWSLVDCISFVIMAERGIGDALTADHHFEQAGFRALLK